MTLAQAITNRGMKLSNHDAARYPAIEDFCIAFLTEADGEVELERLIDAVEVGTGFYAPFLVEVYLYANKILVENERIQNAELDDF